MEKEFPTLHFRIYKGEEFLREQSFNQKTVHIGKLAHSHINLTDENVSRQHAVIEVLESGEVRITDLESTNGTYVNGEKISSTPLKPADEITVGLTKLIIDFEPTFGKEISLKETFYVEPVYKEKEEDTGKYSLEIILLWENEPYIIKHFLQGENVRVGELKSCSIFLPEELLLEKSYLLVKSENGDFLLNLENPHIDGDCLIEGKIYTVKELHKKSMLKDKNFLPLMKDTKCRLRMENFTLLLSTAVLPPAIKTPFFTRFKIQEHIYTGLSLIAHLIFLMLLSLVPEEALKASKDPFERRSEAFKVIQIAEMEKRIEEELKKEKEAKKIELKGEEKKKELTATEDEKQKMRKDAREKELTSKLTPEEIRERTRRLAMETGVTKVLAQQDDLLSQILGGGGIPGIQSGIRVIGSRGVGEGPLLSTLDPFGGAIGAGGGSGGFRGTGTTLGAKSDFMPEEIGSIAGLEKGEAGKGVDVKFRETEQKTIVFVGEAAVSGGELDKETVRRYIQTRINQIKWCYQMEVQRNPELSGQIVVVFIISSMGKVVNPLIKSTTMNNKNVEDCILSRITRWNFPSPKGGGVVRVTYPFIFKLTK